MYVQSRWRFRSFALAMVGGVSLLLLGSATTFAQDQVVSLTNSNLFNPGFVSIDAGEKVTWHNLGGFHNVKFEDGSFTTIPSSDPWTEERTFLTSGIFPYYCEIHGGPGGVGMSGVVEVAAAPPGAEPMAVIGTSVSAATVSFDGSGSSSPFEPIVSYAWNFGDGTNGQGAKVQHTYAQSGTYQVKLTVTDSMGNTAEKTAEVTVTVPVPVSNTPAPTPTSSSNNSTPTSQVGNVKLSIAGGKTAEVSKKGEVGFKVACPTSAQGSCVGVLKLVARLGGKKVTIATKRFTIAKGSQSKVRFKLSSKALKVLKKKTLKTTVVVSSANQTAGAQKTTTLKLGR